MDRLSAAVCSAVQFTLFSSLFASLLLSPRSAALSVASQQRHTHIATVRERETAVPLNRFHTSISHTHSSPPNTSTLQLHRKHQQSQKHQFN
ncbi:hypothetical protein P167DRAFT_425805 [Morchella conica CCBAS932]|uniref:Secreted protein n=1 Tax=Morchella conica CCBAS932 TaxID=1392247 RepID=A0A3N4L1H3_9PEZI|nr:hypothetical protein P167DRAFT_425805 [Morchella conica CCBAS932]